MDKLHENEGETTAKMLNDLLEHDPKDFVALTELGNIDFNLRRYPEAVSFYDRALSYKPDFIDALFGAGRTAFTAEKRSIGRSTC